MRRILAIGGAVVKTALPELKRAILSDKVEMLIHNGGSLFHDFQIASESGTLTSHSFSIEELLSESQWKTLNRAASELVLEYLNSGAAPKGSATELCQSKSIPVLMFTSLGCDWWHLFTSNWEPIATYLFKSFRTLCERFQEDHFKYVCMGSAVIHPEVFLKAIAVSCPKSFSADSVDFKVMYRPNTRVSIYGKYHLMTHKRYLDYLVNWEDHKDG